ncbi:MAG: hypothetical protein JO013_10005 [Alphaproteobacteria bacterium]|nr:hypothetical protein [Alphaproteobacteria bacterium]
MSDRGKCLENARKLDPKAKLCDESLCAQMGRHVHAFCNCLPPYPPQKPCPYGPDSPVPVYGPRGELCYCCCRDVASYRPVAVPDGEARPVEDFRVGDQVLAAGGDLDWSARPVEFSDGAETGEEEGPAMVLVRYRLASGEAALAVTADHVFLLAGGRLARAASLVPGRDRLTSAEGGPVEIVSVEPMEGVGRHHHIATSAQIATGLDGHLLNSKGVVTGDWALQCAEIEDGALVQRMSQAEPA